MKENRNIDELLNSFIDGELTARQRTEAQRLIAHDAQVAQRLRELQKCKTLVSSLPYVEAPAEMLEVVKTSLERRTLLGQQSSAFDQRAGARHLLVRKVLSAAAMIGLVAVLAAVIYTIVGPESSPQKPVVMEDWRQPPGEIELEKPTPSPAATVEKVVAKVPAAVTEFNGRL